MKFVLEITVTKTSGPRVDADEVCDALIDEIDSIDLWTDDSSYEVTAHRVKVGKAVRTQ